MHDPTRRRIIAGLALTAASLTIHPTSKADTTDTRTALHQEIELPAAPGRIESALLDAKQFTAFSGLPATIDPHEGGAFSLFSGQIVGRNIEFVPGHRIVQAWRPAHWDPGVYSLVKFEFRPHAAATTVILDHSSFPAGDYTSLFSGWNDHYWNPLKKYLS
jgi:activator of HSP90 ATPase